MHYTTLHYSDYTTLHYTTLYLYIVTVVDSRVYVGCDEVGVVREPADQEQADHPHHHLDHLGLRVGHVQGVRPDLPLGPDALGLGLAKLPDSSAPPQLQANPGGNMPILIMGSG